MTGGSDGAALETGPDDDDDDPDGGVTGGVIDGEDGGGAGTAEPDGGGAAGLAGAATAGGTTALGDGVVLSRLSRPSRTGGGAASSEADETGPAMGYEPTAKGPDPVCDNGVAEVPKCLRQFGARRIRPGFTLDVHSPCRRHRPTTLTWPPAERR